MTIAEGGYVGGGKGMPYPRYGESIATSLGKIARGADRHPLLGLLRLGAARNAIDCALWDQRQAHRNNGRGDDRNADKLEQVAARYQCVNVKLDKAGGLTAALDLVRAARARGLGAMTGCMVGSSLSIAPALLVAALFDFVDLDGPIWLAEDRSGAVTDARGMLSPPAPAFWGTP